MRGITSRYPAGVGPSSPIDSTAVDRFTRFSEYDEDQNIELPPEAENAAQAGGA